MLYDVRCNLFYIFHYCINSLDTLHVSFDTYRLHDFQSNFNILLYLYIYFCYDYGQTHRSLSMAAYLLDHIPYSFGSQQEFYYCYL